MIMVSVPDLLTKSCHLSQSVQHVAGCSGSICLWKKLGMLWMFTERIKELMGHEATSLCGWSQVWGVKTSQHSGFHWVTGMGVLLTGATERALALDKHKCACIPQKQRPIRGPLQCRHPGASLKNLRAISAFHPYHYSVHWGNQAMTGVIANDT